MVNREYVPDVGDIVWLDFDPQSGREQAGRRPGVVLSPRDYNQKARLAICCPITSHVKGYPFEVLLPAGNKWKGAILSDQLKSLDWRKRNATKAGKIPQLTLDQVLERISLLLNIQ